MTPIRVDAFQRKIFLKAAELAVYVTIPNEVQRALDQDRVADIVKHLKDRLKNTGSFLLLGDIFVAGTVTNNRLGPDICVIDGQHRLAALTHVAHLQPDYQVCITVLDIGPHLTMEDAFVLINKSVPVPDYIVESIRDMSKKRLLQSLECEFIKSYKYFVSKSAQPRRPQINVGHLVTHVGRSTLPTTFHTVHDLMQYICWVNTQFATRDPKVHELATKKAQHKCVYPLFLACDANFSWVYDQDFLQEYVTYTHLPPEQERNKRIKMSSNLRDACWRTEFGDELRGDCPVCKVRQIDIRNFEVGHRIPIAKGGDNALANLRPICRPCNASMGDRYWDEFAQSYAG